ncbi:MAG: FHA domain-containing protein [Nannocystis sp.]|nr:FHA domain-containing protein [Nannocystis sp.]MBA3548185.1 FHA domain-containing protein [Nannocystis sp.]
MINCSNCGKENQDHYKFCLGCGARLAGMAAAPAAPARSPGGTVMTPVQNASPPVTAGGTVVSTVETPAASPQLAVPSLVARGATSGPNPTGPSAPSAAPPASTVITAAALGACPSCGMANPPGFLFCGRCGSRLEAAASPGPAAAPAPVVTSVAAPARSGPVATPVKKAGLRASLHLLREDGSEGGTLHLEDGPVPFGRDYGPPFDTDLYLNPRHCAFTVATDGVRVDDLNPINGVYRKIEGSIELQHGDTFRVGQELLYYEDLPEPEVLPDGTERMGSPNPGYWGRVSVLVETGRACEAMPIVGAEFQIGRERGDLTFPTDGYVSSSHCRIVGDDSGVYLEDRGSSNGTYLRVRSGTVVPFGSLVLIGQQLFHVRTS